MWGDKIPMVEFPTFDLSMLQSPAYGGTIMNADQGKMIIRQAAEEDAWQIADILVEDWKKAYRGIIDSDYLDSMSVEERYRRELQRYRIYRVAAVEKEILGFTWNEMTDDEDADCEIIAIYIRYSKRKSGCDLPLCDLPI